MRIKMGLAYTNLCAYCAAPPGLMGLGPMGLVAPTGPRAHVPVGPGGAAQWVHRFM